jgi:hypothetical protein
MKAHTEILLFMAKIKPLIPLIYHKKPEDSIPFSLRWKNLRKTSENARERRFVRRRVKRKSQSGGQ